MKNRYLDGRVDSAQRQLVFWYGAQTQTPCQELARTASK